MSDVSTATESVAGSTRRSAMPVSVAGRSAPQKYPVAASALAVMGAMMAAPAGVGWTPSALSAESIGVARWATDTAAQYAKIREQFGRPIGQFQAVKHKCAEMIADTERATAAVWDAARAIDEARESGWEIEGSAVEFSAAVAASLAPAAAQRCTQDCIQVHGGIGYTWEHDTNVYYRRALILAASFAFSGG